MWEVAVIGTPPEGRSDKKVSTVSLVGPDNTSMEVEVVKPGGAGCPTRDEVLDAANIEHNRKQWLVKRVSEGRA
jgi:hypothetical protein